MKEVLGRVSLSKSEVYRRMKLGTFPMRIRLGPKRVAFAEADIDSWIASHIEGGRADV